MTFPNLLSGPPRLAGLNFPPLFPLQNKIAPEVLAFGSDFDLDGILWNGLTRLTASRCTTDYDVLITATECNSDQLSFSAAAG